MSITASSNKLNMLGYQYNGLELAFSFNRLQSLPNHYLALSLVSQPFALFLTYYVTYITYYASLSILIGYVTYAVDYNRVICYSLAFYVFQLNLTNYTTYIINYIYQTLDSQFVLGLYH